MNKFIDNLSKFIATFSGIGFMPFMPGTFGSIAGTAIYYFLYKNQPHFYAVLCVVALAGFIFSGRAASALGKKDPKSIVIDEVAGVLISFIAVPFSWLNLVFVFALFRICDVVKPFPIRQLEKMPGSFGIMLDDIVAGIYANIVFQLFFRFALCRAV